MIHKINVGKSWHDPTVIYPVRPENLRSLIQDYTGYCVCQYTKNGELINKFTSTHAAAQKLFNDDKKHSHIAACIRGDRRSA